MKHFLVALSLLTTLFLLSCGETAVSEPTSIPPTSTPAPSPTPENIQATRMAEAVATGEANGETRVSVDFVIDLDEANGDIPAPIFFGDNWFKYTDPNGKYSIAFYGIPSPELPSDALPPTATMLQSRQLTTFYTFAIFPSDSQFSVEQFTESYTAVTNNPLNLTLTVRSTAPIAVNGVEGTEIIWEIDAESGASLNLLAKSWFLETETEVYQLTVAGLEEDALGENGRKFFESLEFLD